MTLLLSWAYHRILACRPDGFEQRHFPLAERWIGYEPPQDREETRLRGWRRILNRLGIADVVWTPYVDPPTAANYSVMASTEYRHVARGMSAPLFSNSGVAPGGPCCQTIWTEAAHSFSAFEHRRDACSRCVLHKMLGRPLPVASHYHQCPWQPQLTCARQKLQVCPVEV
ncbi:hypothetical protein PIB30_087544 [Stylosanthes scabra]|uniref:Aminotransferase-like plant mobile domain-containing protein n=1 Tax=Stylosanthes scabra TaxID=79078 RepID=A0ABU6WX24_9FABA|nr:hypothetical protein [Stylosanthes scabra]